MGLFFKGRNDKNDKADSSDKTEKEINKDLYSTMDLISNDMDFDKDPNAEEEIDPVYLYDAIKPSNTAYYSAGIDRSGDPMSALASGDSFKQKKLTDEDYSSITSVHRESFLKSMQTGNDEPRTGNGTSNIQSAFDNDALNAYYDRNLSGARDTYSEQEKKTNPIFGDLSRVQSNPQEYGNLNNGVRRNNVTYGGSNNYGSAGYGGMDYGNSGYGSSDYGYGGNNYGNSGFGSSNYGQSNYGQSNLGQSNYGQSNYGQSNLGQSNYGVSDHPLFESSQSEYGNGFAADKIAGTERTNNNIVQGYDPMFYAAPAAAENFRSEMSTESETGFTEAAPEETTVPEAEAVPEETTAPEEVPEEAAASETEAVSEEATAPEAEEVPEEAAASETEAVSEEATAPETEAVSEETAAPETEEVPEEAAASEAEAIPEEAAIPETEEVPEEAAIHETEPVQEEITEASEKNETPEKTETPEPKKAASSYSGGAFNSSYYSFLMDDEEDPFADLRKKKEPVREEPVREEPVAEEPVMEETVAEEPVAEEPVMEEPVREESIAEEPVMEEPVAEESVAEESVMEEPVAEEPVAEEPVMEEPVREESIAEEPVMEEPVTEKAVAENAAEEITQENSAESTAQNNNDSKTNSSDQTAWFNSMMDSFMDMLNGKDKEETGKKDNKDKSSQSYSGSYTDGYEDVCFVCRRPESKAGKMFHMPNNISVCADCMRRTMETVSQFDYQGMLGPEMSREDLEKELNNMDGNNGMPRFSFINLANLTGDGGIPNKQKIKRKKAEGKKEEPIFDIKKIPPPHKIREKLDEYVVGQDRAKKIMSVAVYNHYKRVACDTNDDIEIEKSNMLMIGPTGSGKTYLVKTLAKLLDVPLAIADATSLTEAGYIGDDIESVVSKLLAAADNDVERAEKGIIFIDEIDKIAKKVNANARDVSGESVQQGMLKLLEGAEVEVPVGASSKGAMVPLATVDTKNILFICGGAFPDLEDIIKERLMKSSSIGFGATLKDTFDKDKDILAKVKTEDIRKFGMIPEFLGRLPIVFTLESVTKDMLIRILNEPKNAILKQYQKLLALDEVKLQFSDDAIEAIAEKAMEQDTGARALRSIIEDFMLDIMYEIPKDDNIGTVTITGDYIRGTGGPIIGMRGSEMPEIEDKKPETTDDESTADKDAAADTDNAADTVNADNTDN